MRLTCTVHLMHIGEMDLSEWMKKKKLSDADLAAEVKTDRTTVSRWRRKKTRPDWQAIGVLETLSAGKVTARDFLVMGEAAE